MAQSEEDINRARWLIEGREKGALQVLDVCDTFDNSHFPVFVMPGESLKNAIADHNNEDTMQQVFGVIAVTPLDEKVK